MPRLALFPVLAVLAVQPVDCLVQILRCVAKAFFAQLKRMRLRAETFL